MVVNRAQGRNLKRNAEHAVEAVGSENRQAAAHVQPEIRIVEGLLDGFDNRRSFTAAEARAFKVRLRAAELIAHETGRNLVLAAGDLRGNVDGDFAARSLIAVDQSVEVELVDGALRVVSH